MKTTMNTRISLDDASSLVRHVSHARTFLFSGEMGSGKSSMLKDLAKRFPDHEVRYIDCAILDLGDIQMPKIFDDHVRFLPNSLFFSERPVLMMLDELGKASKPVLNALLPLVLEHRVGTYPLPKGSRVFATTNLTTEGLGDNIPAHIRNRMVSMTINKPGADEWLVWAARNDIHPAVAGWVREFPHALASFLEGDSQKENPYIFWPGRMQSAFVSPRSLEAASDILKQEDHLSPEVLIAALSGAVGESAARDMEAFVSVGKDLPRWDDIIADPEKAPLPKSAIGAVVLCMGAIQRMDSKNTDAWFQYLLRLPRETQFLFTAQARQVTEKMTLLATSSRTFTTWAVSNHWAF